MDFYEIEEKANDNGFVQTLLRFKRDCQGCEVLHICSKSEKGRTIIINRNLEQFLKKARENLISPLGIEMRKRLSVDVETAFGNIKHNQGHRRFNLRGLEKVNSEFGLIAIAHNAKKLMKMIN